MFLHVLKSLLWDRTEIQMKVRVQEPGNTGDEGGSQNTCGNGFPVGPICLKAEEVQCCADNGGRAVELQLGLLVASISQPGGLHQGQWENTNSTSLLLEA